MKNNDTYTKLDGLILARIGELLARQRKPEFCLICADKARVEAERIAEAQGCPAYRVIDRRLQSLRKAGKIYFTSKSGWRLA